MGSTENERAESFTTKSQPWIYQSMLSDLNLKLYSPILIYYFLRESQHDVYLK